MGLADIVLRRPGWGAGRCLMVMMVLLVDIFIVTYSIGKLD